MPEENSEIISVVAAGRSHENSDLMGLNFETDTLQNVQFSIVNVQITNRKPGVGTTS